MLTTIITLAILSQAPPPAPTPVPRAQQQHARSGHDYSDVLARKHARDARRDARAEAGKARERAEAEAAIAAAREAQALYVRMLPYLMEQQRQQLDRMSAWERNAALHRMARAMERPRLMTSLEHGGEGGAT